MDAAAVESLGMNGACGSINPDAWVMSLISTADCHAGLLGSGGWQGLAGSNLFNVLLTGLLTLAIARLGYRLMAGNIVPPDIVLLLLHIGVVIALATSWQAYDRLIFRVAMNGPTEIAAAVFPAAGINASGLSARLQNAYDTITTPPDVTDSADQSTLVNANGGQQPQLNSLEAQPGAESLAMVDRRAAADVMVIAGGGSWVAARLSLAVLMALGPFAFAASLFPVSAGLLIGWLRAVVGTALATLVIPLALSIELQMLQGPVSAAMRKGEMEIAGLSPIVWSFAIVIIALLIAVQRFASGLALPLPAMRQSRDLPVAEPGTVSRPELLTSNSEVKTHAHQSVAPSPQGGARTQGIVRAIEARGRTIEASGTIVHASSPSGQTAPVLGSRTIRRGSQIVAGARRTAADRGQYLPQPTEAKA